MRLSLTTDAATGIVPSVSLQPATVGSLSRHQACCRCPMPMWSSPYLSNWHRSHSGTSVCFIACCSGQLRRRCFRQPANPRHLGARIGVLAVLHTWSQNLNHHPHLHCLVPAGGLALDNSRWITTRRRGFFLPVRVLSRMFRGKLLAFLKQSYRRGELCFAGKLAELSTPRAFHSLLWERASARVGGLFQASVWRARTCAEAIRPALNTHRVAISNARLLSLENGQVRFRWRDSRHNNRSSVMKLDAAEFIRRFLLHVLPAGFVKIRHSDCSPTATADGRWRSAGFISAPRLRIQPRC